MTRRVLVTGVRAGGIGEAIRARLEQDGWSVAGAGWPPGTAEFSADLAEPDAVVRLFEDVGPVEALVTAHAHWTGGGLLETTVEEFDRHLAANARGVFLLCREYVRRLGRDSSGGRIVNFVSGPPLPGEIAYASSKGAIHWLTLSIAAEFARLGITANAIDPGPNDTGWMTSEVADEVRARSPQGRIGIPSDVAGLVAFLLGPEGGWMTGQVLRCDGGWSSLT